MGIKVDRRIVLAGFNFKGMSLEYFHEFLKNEFIPAYREELSENEIQQIMKGIEEKKDRIWIFKNTETGRKLTHTFTFYDNVGFMPGYEVNYEFDGF